MTEQKNKVTGKQTINNFLWRFAERMGAQGVSFIVSIVLTRILSPDDFGVVALSFTAIAILSVFVTSGLGKSLIQKDTVDELDYSTALIANVGIGVVLYIVMFFIAPYIAAFFSEPRLQPILRVLSVTLVIGGLNSIQHAKISRAMNFKLFFRATITGTIISAIVGIIMALRGFGAWALIAQFLTNQIIDTVFLWVMIGWKPTTQFSWERFWPMFDFGWKAYGAAMIETLYNQLRSLLIGKYYTNADLAYYNRGRHIPAVINQNTNNAIQSVMFPIYSRLANNHSDLKSMMKKAVKIGTYIIFPCMVGLALVSRSLVEVLYTSKWLPAVPFLQMSCFVFAITPLHVVNLQAILAIGRSDISMKIEMFKKIVAVIVMVICVHISLMATAFSAVPLAVFALIVNAWPVGRELSYPLSEQLIDSLPAFGLSLGMGICVWLVGLVPISSPLGILSLQVITGILVYLGLSRITKNHEYLYVKSYILARLKSNRKMLIK